MIIELLEQYSLTEIVIFIIMFAVAFKSVVTFWDWMLDWVRKKFDKDYKFQEEKDSLNEKVEQLCKITAEQGEAISKINNTLNMLIDSDKDDIKAWIVEQHHYFCYEVKAIDYYSLDAIEKRFKHYKAEHGNSYVEALVQEIQALPKINNEDIRKTMNIERDIHN